MIRKQKISLPNRPKFSHGWYMVAASWVMVFLISAVNVSVFFKPMLEDFGWDRATLSSVQAVALIVFAIISPLLGRLIDRYGPRIMISASIATQVISSAINGVASNIWHLYLARFFYGINAVPATQVLTNRWFTKKKGTALGIVATGRPIGLMILSPISQYLILLWGWRPTMLFWAAITLVITLPLVLIIKNNPEDKGHSPDGEPWDRVKTTSPPPPPGDTALGERLSVKTDSSLSQAVKTRAFWSVSTAHFICGTGCGFMMTHIVIFATDVGFSDMIAASLLSIQGGFTIIGILVTGHFSDRMARSKVLALTHLIRTLSFVTIVIFILTGDSSLWMLYAAMVLFGFGWFTTSPLTAGLVADLFGSRRMGTILGVMTGAHMLGMAIGAYAGGIIFELTQSYYLFFLVQSLLSLLATVLAFAIKQEK